MCKRRSCMWATSTATAPIPARGSAPTAPRSRSSYSRFLTAARIASDSPTDRRRRSDRLSSSWRGARREWPRFCIATSASGDSAMRPSVTGVFAKRLPSSSTRCWARTHFTSRTIVGGFAVIRSSASAAPPKLPEISPTLAPLPDAPKTTFASRFKPLNCSPSGSPSAPPTPLRPG